MKIKNPNFTHHHASRVRIALLGLPEPHPVPNQSSLFAKTPTYRWRRAEKKVDITICSFAGPGSAEVKNSPLHPGRAMDISSTVQPIVTNRRDRFWNRTVRTPSASASTGPRASCVSFVIVRCRWVVAVVIIAAFPCCARAVATTTTTTSAESRVIRLKRQPLFICVRVCVRVQRRRRRLYPPHRRRRGIRLYRVPERVLFVAIRRARVRSGRPCGGGGGRSTSYRPGGDGFVLVVAHPVVIERGSCPFSLPFTAAAGTGALAASTSTYTSAPTGTCNRGRATCQPILYAFVSAMAITRRRSRPAMLIPSRRHRPGSAHALGSRWPDAKLLLGAQHRALVVVERLLQLLVGVDQALHRVVVGRRVRRWHVPLDAARRARAPVRKLLDQVIGEDLLRRGAGDDLLEELGGGPGFFEPVGELDGVGEARGAGSVLEVFASGLLVCYWGVVGKVGGVLLGWGWWEAVLREGVVVLVRGMHGMSMNRGTTYAVNLVCLFLLLPPHLDQQPQVLIVALCAFEGVQRLHEHLSNIAILPWPQQLLGSIDKLLINISCEGRTGIIGEDSYEHDGVVLQWGFGPVIAM